MGCWCRIDKDPEFGIICEVHYSEHMDYPMECEMITPIENAKKIWKKLKVVVKGVDKEW